MRPEIYQPTPGELKNWSPPPKQLWGIPKRNWYGTHFSLGKPCLLVESEWPFLHIGTKHLTLTKYHVNRSVDKAKGRWFPGLRGTWLPSFDIQTGGGLAINWVGIRIRISRE